MSQQTNADLQELVYVCSISAYNLPEFESCLLRRPKYLVLIVTAYEKYQAFARLFSELVQRKLPGIQIIRPDQLQKGFAGSSLQENQQWYTQVLASELDRLPQAWPRVCNITGGTKAMTLTALSPELNWDWLEYKAEGQQKLQMVQREGHGFASIGDEQLPMASPLDMAQLYSERVEQKALNPIMAGAVSQKASSAAAVQLWRGLTEQDAALLSLFGNQQSGFEMLWKYGANNPGYNQKKLELSAQDFVGKPAFTKQQLAWLKTWQALSPAELEASELGIVLANSKKRRSNLRNWLSGDWLEQLAAHWLQNAGVPADQIAVNVKIWPENETNSRSGERESDVLVHYKGQSYVLEVKTDYPPGNTNFSELIKQLSSLGERLGRTRKVLFIGPQLFAQVKDKLEDIQMRCKASNITLAYDYETLVEALARSK